MRWLWMIFWDPLSAFDLRDNAGQPDHSKIAGLIAFLCLYGLEVYLVLHQHIPSAWEWLILGTLPFGWVAWRTLLKYRTVTSTTTEAVTKMLTEPDSRRDDERGDDGAREDG